MAESKNDQSKTAEAEGGVETLPSYEDCTPGPSSSSYQQQRSEGPTVDNPFDFPAKSELPSYSVAAPISDNKPVAIPQLSPDSAAPFVAAYAPTLLNRGIPPDAWLSFVNTLSAFLTAKVSDKAIAHAGDIGRHLGSAPKSFGQGVARNAKSAGQRIRDNAKQGNIVGTATSVVGGAVSLTLGTVFGAVGTIMAMPGAAVGAVARKPQTPLERAAAYAHVANKDWLNPRGLYAQILDTQQLCRITGLEDPRQLIETAGEGKSQSAADQLQRLERYLCELQIENAGKLDLGIKTLWLVVKQVPNKTWEGFSG